VIATCNDRAQSLQPADAKHTLYESWLTRAREDAQQKSLPMKSPPVGALGSGSDYTAFLDHVGIASLDLGVTGRGNDGTYHSTYDNPTWFKTFIDPHFAHSVLAAQVTGVTMLRLADAEVLPFDYESYGRQILDYLTEIEQQAVKTSDGAKQIDFAGMSGHRGLSKAGADLRAAGLLNGADECRAGRHQSSCDDG
jgi:N-acetylated-alpha-linked acidic dipeptidase